MKLNIGCGYDFWGDVRLDSSHSYLGKRTTASIIADAQKLPFQDFSFEDVKASHVLEHLPDWRQASKEWMRVTKNKLIVSFPVGDGFKRHALCDIFHLNLSGLKISALSRKLHVWEIKQEVIEKIMGSQGFKCQVETHRCPLFPTRFLKHVFLLSLEHVLVGKRQ